MKFPAVIISFMAIFALLLVQEHTHVYASEPETELFNKGYEYLFSYKPDKAAEVFRQFLKDFPESSARDAAMFWLGKTLISLRAYSEAEQMFNSLRTDFPESPFISFLDIEMEEIVRLSREAENRKAKEAAVPTAPKESIQREPAGIEKTKEPDKKLSEAVEERDRIKALLTAEQKTRTEQQARIADLETKEASLQKQKTALEDQLNKFPDIEKTLKKSTEEKERVAAELSKMTSEKKQTEKERDELREKIKASEKMISLEEYEALRQKISGLEAKIRQQDEALRASREAGEKTVSLLEEEKKASADLKQDLALLKDREKEAAGRLARAEELQKSEKDRAGTTVSELDRSKALLDAERKAAAEKQARIADLEAKETLLRKQNSELEQQTKKLAETEKRLKETSAEKQKLASELARLSSEITRTVSERDELREKAKSSVSKIELETIEPLRQKISELETKVIKNEESLKTARKEGEKTASLLEEERKVSVNLKRDLALLKDREKDAAGRLARAEELQKSEKDKAGAAIKEKELLSSEAAEAKALINRLQENNRSLSDRIEDMEQQAEQRIRDMKILNTYLTKLMFQKKEDSRQKQSQPLTEAPARQISQPAVAVKIGDRDFELADVIAYQIRASGLFLKLAARDIIWRTGNPLDDFINEELLFHEAKRAGTIVDAEKVRNLTKKHGLSSSESELLQRFLHIAKLIDMKYSLAGETAIEMLSVEYRAGDAASKTVLATDLQKAARSGKSFEEIKKSYSDNVKYARLSIQEFSAKYREKSQVIQKLNFIKEETVVMWSERGYMLIKPVMLKTLFDPFAEMKKEEKEKTGMFIKGYIEKLK